jgi:hypothetical protein
MSRALLEEIEDLQAELDREQTDRKYRSRPRKLQRAGIGDMPGSGP